MRNVRTLTQTCKSGNSPNTAIESKSESEILERTTIKCVYCRTAD